MTMRELAKLANVSVSTVSKAFQDAEDVSRDTKQHIFNVAREHGCYGKFYKGKYSKKIIAIICPELRSNYYVGYVEKIQSLIEENNGMAIVSAYHFDYHLQAELVEYYASYLQVDGIIVFNLMYPLKKGYDIPIVSIFSSSDKSVDAVEIDFEPAVFEAVGLLKSLGHKKIAFITEELTRNKAQLFEKAICDTEEIDGVTVHTALRFEKAGRDGVEKLLSGGNDCTAIICAYDYMAIGAIKQLKNMGYSVPQDFSVIGIDNICVSEYVETSLTTIDTNIDEICMITMELMYKKQKNKFYRSNQRIVISGKLIVRESVAKAKTK